MPIRLANTAREIDVRNLKDGQIGVITKWTTREYFGRIVQRMNNSLITIGKSGNNSWSDFYNVTMPTNCFVRVLENGELIEVIDNQ